MIHKTALKSNPSAKGAIQFLINCTQLKLKFKENFRNFCKNFFYSLRRYAIRGSNGFSAEFRRDAVRWRGFLWMINDSTRSVSLGFPLKAKMATKCSKVSPFPPFSKATSGFPSSKRLSVTASPRCTASWHFFDWMVADADASLGAKAIAEILPRAKLVFAALLRLVRFPPPLPYVCLPPRNYRVIQSYTT